jgi:hypothetical protein
MMDTLAPAGVRTRRRCLTSVDNERDQNRDSATHAQGGFMENRQRRTHAAFGVVLDFLGQHPMTPEPPLLAKMRNELTRSYTRLNELGVKQYAANITDAAKDIARLRQRLRRERMMPMVRIAKPLLKFAPGAESALRVSHARADTMTVAADALRMAKVLAPHAKLIASAGYSTSFISEFRAEARALAAAATNVDKARQARSHITGAIAAEIKNGMKAMTVIEGILMPAFAKDAVLEQLWRNRRRIPKRAGRPSARARKSRATDQKIA